MPLHRIHRGLCKTAAPFVLIAILGADFGLQTLRPYGSRGTLVQKALEPRRRNSCGGDFPEKRQLLCFNLFRTAQGDIEMRPTSLWSGTNPSAMDQITLMIDRDDHGLYSITRYDTWAKIVGPGIAELQPKRRELHERLLNMCSQSLGVLNFEKYRTELLNGKTAFLTGPSYLGYAHNAIALILLASLGWSLTMNAPKLSPMRLWKLLRTPPQNACPNCGYSTIGLTTSTCPECGNVLMEPPASGSG